MRTNHEKQINLEEIKKLFNQNPMLKKAAYVVLAIGAIYIGGKLANGMASAVRGFKNLGSAFKGE